MAGLNKMIRGFAIMESLVAMIIITFSFSMAGMIYVNVMDFKNEAQKANANALIDEALFKTASEKRFIDEKWSTEVFEIVKKVSRYNKSDDLHLVQVSICDKNGKKISAKKQLVFGDL